jgi:hypothetical protein
VAGTYDGSEMKLYVNGELVGTLSAPEPDTFTNPVTMGSGYGTGWFLNGTIDEVRIYNRALTEEEIRDHYVFGY